MASVSSLSLRNCAPVAPVKMNLPTLSRLILPISLMLACSACMVIAVADAAATVVATTVKVGATVVGTTVDVAAAGVRAVADSGDKKD